MIENRQQCFTLSVVVFCIAIASSTFVPLKKRLLSGPAPEPVVLQDASSLRRYVGYAACQAHACSDTHLRLLYAPASKAMVGRLALAGKVEFLGKPSLAERALLEQAQTTP